MYKYEYVKSEYVFMGGGNYVTFVLMHETDYVGTEDEVSYDVWIGANDEYVNVWEGLNQAPYEFDEIPEPDMSWLVSNGNIPRRYLNGYYMHWENSVKHQINIMFTRPAWEMY